MLCVKSSVITRVHIVKSKNVFGGALFCKFGSGYMGIILILPHNLCILQIFFWGIQYLIYKKNKCTLLGIKRQRSLNIS